MSLVKYNPNIQPLFNRFEDIFDIFDAFDPISRPTHSLSGPKTNVENIDGKHIISIATPGIDKDDLKVDIGDGRISISYDQESGDGSNSWIQKSFARSWNLPKNVNIDAISAAYDNGVLRVTVPKNEETVPIARRIEIV